MATERQTLFGSDLLLAEYAGGLDLSGAAARGDLALAQGNDNIVQALTLRLRVRQGELAPLGWPDYGSRLHELIGELNVRRTQLKAQAFARAAIEADPRVVKVLEVTAVPEERTSIRLSLTVQLIDRQSPLNLVVIVPLEQP